MVVVAAVVRRIATSRTRGAIDMVFLSGGYIGSGRVRGTGRGYGTSHEDTVRDSSGPPVRNTHGRPDCAQPRQISRRRTIHPSVNILCHRARDTGFGGMRPPRETRATSTTHARYVHPRLVYQPISLGKREKKRKGKERDTFFSLVFFFFVYLSVSLLFDDISDPRIQRGARLTTGRTNGRVLSMLVTMEEMRYNRGRRSKVIADRSTSSDRILKTDLCASL